MPAWSSTTRRCPPKTSPSSAVRPYPLQYCVSYTTKDQIPVEIRPIRPEDEPLLVKFHQTLSEQKRGLRYFAAVKFDSARYPMRLPAARLLQRLLTASWRGRGISG